MQNSKEEEKAPSGIGTEKNSFSPVNSGSETSSLLGESTLSMQDHSENNDSFHHTEEELLRLTLVNRYDIIKCLGTGNMGIVFLANELALDRDVVIKMLPEHYFQDNNFIFRFKREARLAAKLEHPNIVRIYQISEEKNICFIVMNYISGGTLTEQIEQHGPLPLEKILTWSMDIVSALAYAHDHDIIHRDLKPDNIMIDKDNRAIVTDFGIARATQDPKITQTGLIIGTPKYMSPEQAIGEEVDIRSDIYSMGLIIYEMATKNFPFDSKGIQYYLYSHISKKPVPPRRYNSDIPSWLNDIILKCLEKDPNKRFQGTHDLRIALSEHKSPEPVVKVKSSVDLADSVVSQKKISWIPQQANQINSDTREYVNNILNEIPNLPVNTRRLILQVSDMDSDSKEIAKLASSDPVLVSSILQDVNSSYYGLSRKTSNLHFAIVRLGLSEVRRIVLKQCFSDELSADWSFKGYNTRSIWQHSYLVSICTEYFAKRVMPKMVGSLITYSILHDIGKFVLFKLAMKMKRDQIPLPDPEVLKKTSLMLQKEEALFNVNHTIVGSLLAEKWELPEQVCSVIEYHHNPSFLDIDSIPLEILNQSVIICLSDIIIHRLLQSKDEIPVPEPEYFDITGLEYPLEKNISPELKETIANAHQYLKS
ncbi:protein kinase [Candidatus Latescibacterota bacterium]